MDLCDDVDTNLARTIPRICATNKFDAQIHGNVRRCGAGLTDVLWLPFTKKNPADFGRGVIKRIFTIPSVLKYALLRPGRSDIKASFNL